MGNVLCYTSATDWRRMVAFELGLATRFARLQSPVATGPRTGLLHDPEIQGMKKYVFKFFFSLVFLGEIL
jgi:hypothetical protein